MVVRLYAVFDRVAQQCGPLVDSVNDGTAMRQFKDAFRENVNRQDYQLLYVGEFDQAKGVLLPVIPPVVVEATADVLEAVNGR